jgi:alpha-beta hydrolase superfamily lysophospholipase
MRRQFPGSVVWEWRLEALSRIQAQQGELKAPLLVLHGAADTITHPEGSPELRLHARSTDKTLKLYDGLYHDLLHAPEKEQVVHDLLQWLDARVVAPPVVSTPVP